MEGQMQQESGSRSVVPDGPKLRAPREKTGKTQKELLRGTKLGLRTYQRAEQGLPVSRALLTEIAGALRVPMSDLVLGKSSARRGAVRLHSCDGKGGVNLLRELQILWGELKFDFQVDPYGQIASQISDIVRFCQMHHGDSIDKFLAEPEFIEVAGELNTRIAELYAEGVNVFYAGLFYWDSGTRKHDGKELNVPRMNERLTIVFSDQPEAMLTPVECSNYETKESVFKRCHLRNRANGVMPGEVRSYAEGMSEGSFVQEYVPAYEAFAATRQTVEPF
jgi:transcriptional regulator with XRE-family HTH domain